MMLSHWARVWTHDSRWEMLATSQTAWHNSSKIWRNWALATPYFQRSNIQHCSTLQMQHIIKKQGIECFLSDASQSVRKATEIATSKRSLTHLVWESGRSLDEGCDDVRVSSQRSHKMTRKQTSALVISNRRMRPLFNRIRRYITSRVHVAR